MTAVARQVIDLGTPQCHCPKRELCVDSSLSMVGYSDEAAGGHLWQLKASWRVASILGRGFLFPITKLKEGYSRIAIILPHKPSYA